MTVLRTTCRRQGSKIRQIPWLLDLCWGLNPLVYNEVCAGGASFLLARQPVRTEILNDLDDNVYALHLCLKDAQLNAALKHRIAKTNYSTAEFLNAKTLIPSTLVEKAWRFLVLSSMSLFAKEAHFDKRMNSQGFVGRSGFWWGYPQIMDGLHHRLRKVIINKEEAVSCLNRFDSVETLHYVDPDYLGASSSYEHSVNHQRLCEVLITLKGYVMLSGYDNDLYNSYLLGSGWTKKVHPSVSHTESQKVRQECIWINPKLREHQDRMQGIPKDLGMFEGVMEA